MNSLSSCTVALLVLAFPVVAGCADHPPPAASPSTVSTASTSTASSASAASSATSDPEETTAETDAGARGPLEREAARLDAAMRKARERMDAGGAKVDSAARDEWTALEKRYAVVRQQLRELGEKTDQRASKVGHETKEAAQKLREDLNHLVDRLTH
jgi:hypothetical protein